MEARFRLSICPWDLIRAVDMERREAAAISSSAAFAVQQEENDSGDC
jgi:hypothetical protein